MKVSCEAKNCHRQYRFECDGQVSVDNQVSASTLSQIKFIPFKKGILQFSLTDRLKVQYCFKIYVPVGVIHRKKFVSENCIFSNQKLEMNIKTRNFYFKLAFAKN